MPGTLINDNKYSSSVIRIVVEYMKSFATNVEINHLLMCSHTLKIYDSTFKTKIETTKMSVDK